MVDSTDPKRTLTLKKIFRPQPAPLRTSMSTHGLTRAETRPMVISPPILHHSSSIYSLATPTRNSHAEKGLPKSADAAAPYMLSPPPTPSPKTGKGTKMTRTSSSPGTDGTTGSPRTSPSFSRHTLAHSTLASHYQRFQNLTERISSLPPSPSISMLRKQPDRKGLGTDHAPGDQECDDSCIRRHSCSSTAFRSTSSGKQKRVAPGASPAATAAAFAAMPPMPTQSKSTPLHKVKTYNVHRRTPKKVVSPEARQQQDIEKLRKMQELEDLISGRRGSTLKLSLTPKVVS